jgi:uncharacterized membrane protein
VTGIELTFHDTSGNQLRQAPVLPGMAPIGQGQTVSVAAGGSLTIGPFPLAFGHPGNSNSFQMVPPGSQPANTQGAHPPQRTYVVGARVTDSGGTINIAGPSQLLVSYGSQPPPGYQGGRAEFSAANNSALVPTGVA